MLSSTPIAISNRPHHHARTLSNLASSAFAPWSTIAQQDCLVAQPAPQPVCDPSRIHVSPATSFNFKVASPPGMNHIFNNIPEPVSMYDTSVIEQEHCTGYECCNTKLGDMHAVMEHYEQAHSVDRFGSSFIPAPRQLPVPRPTQPFVAAPAMPLLIPQRFQAEHGDFSAPSPASTSSGRGRSLSIPDDEAEFDIDLDGRMPQTPPAIASHAQRVAIVGTQDFNSPDGYSAFHHNPMGFTNASPFSGNHHVQKQLQPSATGFSGINATHLQPSYSEPQTPADEVPPPLMQSHYVQGPGPLDVDADPSMTYGQDVQQGQVDYYPPPSYPGQRQLSRPQISRQHSLHITPTPPPMYAPNRSHSFHEIPQQPPVFNARPVHTHAETFAAPRPIAHSPAPAFTRQLECQSMDSSPVSTPVSARPRNGSMPFPSAPAAAPVYTSRKRSFDEVEQSQSYDEGDDAYDEEDDEDAEGELEIPSLGPAIVMQSKAATGRKGSSTAPPKEKRAKAGRPKAPRASAQKDPKRAKLFCPKPGCTKRYMNPNGLKYHLEKGTCSFAQDQ